MHNKQFIITKRKFINDSFNTVSWNNGYYLYFHKELNVFKTEDSLLIGHAFQSERHRDIPEKELVNMELPIETYNTWNGRWVLLYKNEIHPDACAQIAIFYGEINNELVISSSLALISEVYKDEFSINEHMPLEYNLLLSWIPGPFTVIDGINRLLPTQYLKMGEGFEVWFRNPISKTDYSKLSIEEIYNKIFDLQKCAFKYIEKYNFSEFIIEENRKNIFNIGLTAGYDSRMQVSLMKHMDIAYKAHTFERQKSTDKADNKYPKLIAQILDVEWNYIPIGKRQSQRVIEYNMHTYNSVKDRDWKWHYTCGQYDKVDGDIVVSNSIWEAFCDYYTSFGSKASIDATFEMKYKDLKCIFESIEGNPLAEKSFKAYIDWVEKNPIDGLSWQDRIAFEQLMGIWDGNENLGKDLFSHSRFMFNPANTMEIFALILSLPKDKRKNRLWEKEMVDKYAPELDNIPYNNSFTKRVGNYYFPYREEINDSDVVLYGAGNVGKSFYMHITTHKKCNIVSWIDKNYKEICKYGIRVDAPEIIRELVYDYVIVAVESEAVYKSILADLLKIGVSADRILWKETRDV